MSFSSPRENAIDTAGMHSLGLRKGLGLVPRALIWL